MIVSSQFLQLNPFLLIYVLCQCLFTSSLNFTCFFFCISLTTLDILPFSGLHPSSSQCSLSDCSTYTTSLGTNLSALLLKPSESAWASSQCTKRVFRNVHICLKLRNCLQTSPVVMRHWVKRHFKEKYLVNN